MQGEAETPSSEWRIVSRSARLAAVQEDYERAIALYKDALALQARDRAHLEPAIDLKLSLVECYRLDGRLKEAVLILDGIAPQVVGKNCKDSLLPARYWRKRSQIDSDLGNNKAAAEAYLQAFLVVARYFPESNSHSLSSRQKLQVLIKKAPDSAESLIAALRAMRNRTMLEDDRQVFDQLDTLAVAVAGDLMEVDSLEKSAKFISDLSESSNRIDDVLTLWSLWIGRSMQAKPNDKMMTAGASLSRMIAELHKRNTPESTAQEINARLWWATILTARKQESDCLEQWRLMTEMFKQMHGNKDYNTALIMKAAKAPMALLNMLVDYLIDHPVNDETSASATILAEQWSRLNMPIDPKCKLYNFNARCALARCRLVQGKPTEAEEPLANIIPESPLQNRRLAEIHLDAAQAYLTQGNKAKAKEHLRLFAVYLRQAPIDAGLLTRGQKLSDQLD